MRYRHTNGLYYLMFVYSIDQHRNECLYTMVILNYSKKGLPEMFDVLDGQFLGHMIPNSLNPAGSEYGLAVVKPDHTALIKYTALFEKIGEIRNDNNCIGSYGGVITQQDFEDDLVRLIENRCNFGINLYDVCKILKE